MGRTFTSNWKRLQNKKKKEPLYGKTNGKAAFSAPQNALKDAAVSKRTGTKSSDAGKNLTWKAKQSIQQNAKKQQQTKIAAAQKAQKNATDRRSKAAANEQMRRAKYPLSTNERNTMSFVEQDEVRRNKALWDRGQAEINKGNKRYGQSLQNYAHITAEGVRNPRGFSGGESGSDYLLPVLSEKEERTMTSKGKRDLRYAKLLYNGARADKDSDGMESAKRFAQTVRENKHNYDRKSLADFEMSAHRTDAHGRPVHTPSKDESEKNRHFIPNYAKATKGFLGTKERVKRSPNGRTDAHGRPMYTPDEQEAEGQRNFFTSPAKGLVGSALSLAETAQQATRNAIRNRNDPIYQSAKSAYDLYKKKAMSAETDEEQAFYQSKMNEMEGRMRAFKTNNSVSQDKLGQRLMKESQEGMQKVLDSVDGGLGKLTTQAAMSAMQIAPGLAAAPFSGGASLGIIGAQAAGQKAHELNERGIGAGEALGRGLVSGGIEALTEKVPLDNIVKLVSGKSGRSVIKNIFRQSGVEATEEAVSYIANYAADKAAKDPTAQFSISELFESAAVGGISGIGFGGAGSVVGSAVSSGATLQAQPNAAQNKSAQSAVGKRVLPTAAEQQARPGSESATPVLRNAPPKASEPAEVGRIVLPTVENTERTVLPAAKDAEKQIRIRNAKTETERTGIAAGVADETIAQAERLSNALGRNILFYESPAAESGIQNGYYQNETIHINAKSQSPVAQIIGHELTHSVETAGAYSDLSDSVAKRIKQVGGDISELVQQKRDVYARNGVTLSDADAQAEVVAEYVEKNLLTDEQSIVELTRENRTLSQRILQFIDNLLAKLGNASAQERAFLSKAKGYYKTALAQTQERNAGVYTAQGQATTTQAMESEYAASELSDSERIEKSTLEELREAYYNGEITDDEFDEALDVIMEEESLLDKSMLDKRYSISEEQKSEAKKFSVSENEEKPKEAKLPTAEEDAKKRLIENLPRKAKDYLNRAEGTLVRSIGNVMSVPRLQQRTYLKDIAREISSEYLENGSVSQKTVDSLFETAYEKGTIADNAFYETYREVKDHLRKQAVTISETDKADIADFKIFKKSAFGTLRIVNEGGTPVDVAYLELMEMAPELFPESITRPADQIVRMYEVGHSIQKTEKSLDEYFGKDAEEFKQWAKHDFEVAVSENLTELRSVKRYSDERNLDAERVVPKTKEEVAELYKNLKDERRKYERAAAKNLLTKHDEVQISRLLRGELELENLDPQKDNVKGITAVYEAKKEYDRITRLIKDYNKKKKSELRELADGYLETAGNWKDKKAGILYSRETMERNIRDIVPDKKLADNIVSEYFSPVHKSQADATRDKNAYRDRVSSLNLSRKVERGNVVSEAHAVQLYGEATDNITTLEQSKGRLKVRDGKSLAEWRSVVDNLWAENQGLDRQKIKDSVLEFRDIYDDLFTKMNNSRLDNGYEPVNYRKGYFPHFQPGEGEGILSQFGKALGIDTAVSSLPTTINGLTHQFKPGIRWFGNAQERLGFNTAYDAVEGFDRYIEGVADVIHQTENIQRLRALATQVRYRTSDEGIRKQVDAVVENTLLSEQDKQNRIDKIYEKGKFELGNFVVELDEYTNLLANKKSRSDRDMEQALGRRMYTVMKNLESRVAANMVAVNPASWLTNFIPLSQGSAGLSRGRLLQGMWDTLRAYNSDDGFASRSAFLTNRRGSDPLVKTWARKASETATKPMEYIDQFTADTLVRARYQQNIKRGLSEESAMAEADSWTAGVMADRSKGSMPTLFHRSNPLTKLFTQFQLEVNNQLSYLFKDIPRDAAGRGAAVLVGSMFKFLVGAFLYDELYEWLIGRRPALDPLGIINDTVGDITGKEIPNLVDLGVGAVRGEIPSFSVEKKGTYGTIMDNGKQILEELPFIGGVLGGGRIPISSAIPNMANLMRAATDSEWAGKKRVHTAVKELSKPASYILPPFGGGQLKKVLEGIGAVARGGSYSVDNDGNDTLQYPVSNETPLAFGLNAARASIFGKATLPTAREWIEGGFKSMNAKKTAVYQGMTQLGVPNEEAFRFIKDISAIEKTEAESATTLKIKFLNDSGINKDGKTAAFYGLVASDSERAMIDEMTKGGVKESDAANAIIALKAAKELDGDAEFNAKTDAVLSSNLTEDEKAKLFSYAFGSKQDDGTYKSKHDDDIEAYRAAGGSLEQYSKMQGEIEKLKPTDGAENVSSTQKWRVAVDSSANATEQMAALKSVMSESEYVKLEAGHSLGISPGTYVSYKDTVKKYDADGNGSIKQEEAANAIASMSVSNETKAILWQLQNKSWKSKNNPFSASVGERAYRSLQD